MNMTFTEEQHLIIDSSGNFLKKEFHREMMREIINSESGYSENLWRKIVDLGWVGMDIPKKYGGLGMDLFNAVLICENMGKAGLLSPYFTNYIACQILVHAGTETQKKDILSKVIQGEYILTFACAESNFQFDPFHIETRLNDDGEGFIVNGQKQFVQYADIADYAVCIGRTNGENNSEEGITIFLLDLKREGVQKTRLNTIAKDKQFEVSLNNVFISNESIIGQKDRGGSYLSFALNRARIIKNAEQIGRLQYALETAIAYTHERVQGGKKIGSYQSIQHTLAEIATEIDGGKYLLYKIASSEEVVIKDLFLLSLWVEKIYVPNFWKIHEIFGAISITDEFDLHFYTKFAKAHHAILGDEHYYTEALKTELF